MTRAVRWTLKEKEDYF